MTVFYTSPLNSVPTGNVFHAVFKGSKSQGEMAEFANMFGGVAARIVDENPQEDLITIQYSTASHFRDHYLSFIKFAEGNGLVFHKLIEDE